MKRRNAREFSLQLLFQYDFTRKSADDLLGEFWSDKNVEKEVRDFADDLFRGTVKNMESIDTVLKETAEHWVLQRMAAVDRNILRAACYEIIYRKDIPPIVTINESLEIAKKYSSAEASSFINGLLDKIAKKYAKVLR